MYKYEYVYCLRIKLRCVFFVNKNQLINLHDDWYLNIFQEQIYKILKSER